MITTPFDQLRQDVTAYMRTSTLAALAELDLGTVLLSQGNSLMAGRIAEICALDLRGTTVLLDAIVALGYFSKSGAGTKAHYAVGEEFKDYLDSRSPTSLIPIIRHMANGQRSWARLTWSVKDGKPQERVPSILGSDQDRISFILGMNSVAVTLVEGTMQSLQDAGVFSALGQDISILDVGGASGTYTEAFLRKISGSKATIFDLPVAIAQAKNRFAGSDLESRIQLVEGDFTKDNLPAGFDFAWISAIIHQFGRELSCMLYGKTWEALKPGGLVAVRDYVMNAQRTSPVDGALFGINMFVNTQDGMVYTFLEIKEDLELAGFTDVKHAVDVPSMSAVVTARKPA